MDTNSLAHTKWNCKYHIVFAPKYRRKVIYGDKKSKIGKILRELCEWKGVEIIEAQSCVDHIHILGAGGFTSTRLGEIKKQLRSI